MASRYRLFATSVAFTILLLLVSPALRAQSWQWLQDGSGSGDDLIGGMALDSLGNAYAVGTFHSNIAFNSTIFTDGPATGLFVVKYSALGIQQWAIAGVGPGNVLSTAIAVSPAGEVYITGTFNGSIRFGVDTLVSTGGTDAFLARFNSGGILRWGKRIATGPTDAWARGITLDNVTQMCYVAGNFADSARFDTSAVTGAGGTDIFLSKYNAAGVIQWARSGGGPGNEEAYGAGIDGSADVYVAGRFTDSTFFATDTVLSAGGTDAAVWKFSTTGAPTWIETMGGPLDDRANAIAVDAFGNSYITGAISDTTHFDTTVVSSRGGTDAFVAKVDGVGTIRWVRRAGSDLGDEGYGLGLDATGNVYVTGAITDTSDFGGTVLPILPNNSEAFVAQYDGAGVFKWVRTAGGAGRDEGHAVTVDRNAELRVGGEFTGPAQFGSINAAGGGNLDVFVAKLGSDPQVNLGLISENSYCIGDQFQVPFSVKGVFGNGNYFVAQLSDSSGSFATPIEIGRVFGIGSTVIVARLADSVIPGRHYRIRVISTVPEVHSDPDPTDIEIFETPKPVVTPAGPILICNGDSVLLDAGPGFTTYHWNSGDVGRLLLVTGAGEYAVTVSNDRGCLGTSPRVIVSVRPPQKPVITRVGQSLETTPAITYQWLMAGQPLSGATNRSYTPAVEGVYYVRITDSNGCTQTSDPFNFTFAAVPLERQLTGVSLYPRPTGGVFTVEVPGTHGGHVTVTVSNALGQSVARLDEEATADQYRREIDLSRQPAGAYFVRVVCGVREWSGQIIKQ
ncbi:MAG TPA: T9SS type A sorting domain-containing protein [Candidatus Kapabacteria bacterium]|nr:T9SS type A sorting domain-containing protein [Candidatus Kapabacteria bacterium]